MAGSLPLLTKVQPPSRRADALRRQRLLDVLFENFDRKLLLVLAPAGYGKTTLLTDLAEESPVPVAWLTLDPADRDPASFIEYLVRALQVVAPRFGATTLSALRATTEIEARSAELARTLAADLHMNLPGVSMLVMDDFHEVNDSAAVTGFLDELLRILPENLRVVVAGRTLVNLTVSRLAVDGQLFGVGLGDLRFSPAEVAALLRQRYGVDLDAPQVEELTEKTEGWIAGLLLSIHGLDGAVDSLTRLGISGHGPLYTYLADEAYDRQPPEMRQFMLVTSTVRTVTAEACSALMGPGNWMDRLADAERSNLFVARLGGHQPAYRYHQLFREFLQGRLRGEQPEQFETLHLRAARYRAAEQDWPGAIEHFHEAQAYDEAARLVARIAPELEREGRWYLLARTIDELPEEVREGSSRLQLARARAAALTGDLKGAEVFAHQAIALSSEEGNRNGHAWALQVLGNALRRLSRTQEALDALHSARDLVSDDEELVATVRRELAGCYGMQGEWQAAALEFQSALAYFAGAGNTYEAARAAYGVGWALARMGRADEACKHYAEALARWREAGDPGNVALVLNNMGYIRSFQGDFDVARALLEEGLEHANIAGHRFAQACLHDSLGSLLLSRGDLSAAAHAFRTGMAIAQDAGDLWTATATMEGAGLCALLEGDTAAATDWFERGIGLAERQQSAYRLAQIAVDRGVVLLQRGEVGSALSTLTAAEAELDRLYARRDVVRTRVWLAHAHFRRGDPVSAGAYFQAAAEEAATLNIPALLDLPARWDIHAFAGFPAGRFQEVQAAVLERVRGVSCPTRPTPPSVPTLPRYRAFSFGRARVLDERDEPVEWSREKARELFFYLLHMGATRSARIAEDLWPDVSPARAKPLVYQAVYTLRQATWPDAVQVAERTYSLRPEVVAYHDLVEFNRLYAEIRVERDEERRLGLMEQLATLHSGRLLDDIDAEWASDIRRTYELRHLDTLESLVAAYVHRGRWEACLKRALEGIHLDPHCEAFYDYAGQAYRALGKPWSARRLARRRLGVLNHGD